MLSLFINLEIFFQKSCPDPQKFNFPKFWNEQTRHGFSGGKWKKKCFAPPPPPKAFGTAPPKFLHLLKFYIFSYLVILITKFVKLQILWSQMPPCRPRKQILLNIFLGLSECCHQAPAKASSSTSPPDIYPHTPHPPPRTKIWKSISGIDMPNPSLNNIPRRIDILKMYSLYRVTAGNFKIQNSLNANADKLIFDSGHDWKQWVVRIIFNCWGSHLKSSPEWKKCHFRHSRFQNISRGACPRTP